jgi:phosphatidylserine/phosphatidylglycerophosphate/cardiolipin synthase-like enzyme
MNWLRATYSLALIIALNSTAYASIKTYFNLREGVSYVDPYTGTERPGDDLENVVLQEIKLAKKSVLIAVQELRLPLVAKLLVEKHKQGLDVRVVLEAKYNHNVLAYKEELPAEDDHEGVVATKYRHLVALIDQNDDKRITRQEMLERDAIFILNQARIPIIDDTEDGTSGSALMHHKFVVIDGKSVVLSSANFTPNCIHGDYRSEKSLGKANALVTVKSTALAKIFTEEFEILWSAKFGKDKPFRGARTVTVAGKKITVQFSPSPRQVDSKLTTNGLIGKTIESAKNSIHSALFVFASQSIADKMYAAHKKRVDVSMLVERRFAYRFYSDMLDLLGYQLMDHRCVIPATNMPWRPRLKRAGHTELAPLDFLHHKFGVIDSKRVIFGSHNWTEAADRSNDEFIVVIDDVAVGQQFQNEYDRLTKKAQWGLPATVEEQIRQREERCQAL